MSNTGKHKAEHHPLDDMFRAAAQDMAGDATSAGDDIWFRLEAKLEADQASSLTSDQATGLSSNQATKPATETVVTPINAATETQDRERRPVFFWWGAAASVVLCLGVFYWTMQSGGQNGQQIQVAQATKSADQTLQQALQNAEQQLSKSAEQNVSAELNQPKISQNQESGQSDYLPYQPDKMRNKKPVSSGVMGQSDLQAQDDQAPVLTPADKRRDKSLRDVNQVVPAEQGPAPTLVKPSVQQPVVQPGLAKRTEQVMELEVEIRPMTKRDQQLLAQEEVIPDPPKPAPELKPSGSKVVNWLTRMNDLRKGRTEPDADSTSAERPSLFRRLTRE